jgi:hypothetical protein
LRLCAFARIQLLKTTEGISTSASITTPRTHIDIDLSAIVEITKPSNTTTFVSATAGGIAIADTCAVAAADRLDR